MANRSTGIWNFHNEYSLPMPQWEPCANLKTHSMASGMGLLICYSKLVLVSPPLSPLSILLYLLSSAFNRNRFCARSKERPTEAAFQAMSQFLNYYDYGRVVAVIIELLPNNRSLPSQQTVADWKNKVTLLMVFSCHFYILNNVKSL